MNSIFLFRSPFKPSKFIFALLPTTFSPSAKKNQKNKKKKNTIIWQTHEKRRRMQNRQTNKPKKELVSCQTMRQFTHTHTHTHTLAYTDTVAIFRAYFINVLRQHPKKIKRNRRKFENCNKVKMFCDRLDNLHKEEELGSDCEIP